MPIASAVSSLLTRMPNGPGFDRFMSALSNPSPNNITPVLATEAMNIPGKCAFAAKRTGFLEFQERLFEEVTTGVMWLFGVKMLGKAFDWGWKRLAPGESKHIDTDIDWGRYKKAFMGLTPGERYAFNHQEWKRILSARGARLGFSIASTLGVISLLLPWLNLQKTEWILKRFYRQTPPAPPANSPAVALPSIAPTRPMATPPAPISGASTTTPPPAARQTAHPTAFGLPPRQNTAWIAGAPNAAPTPYFTPPAAQWTPSSGLNALSPSQNTAWIPAPAPYFPAFGYYPPFSPAQRPTPSIQFGFSGGSLLRGLSHAIENTDTGHILVIDGGIVAGRADQDYHRSPFAGLEVVYREGASLYFYILAMPHLCEALNRVMKPALATTTLLDPAVAQLITDRLMKDPTLQKALASGEASTERVNALLQDLFDGRTGRLADELERATQRGLSHSMRLASVSGESGFERALSHELDALFTPQEAQRLRSAMMADIPAGDALHANDAYQLVQRLEKREGMFSSLTTEAAENASLAVKHAFGATAGVCEQELKAGVERLAQSFGEDPAPIVRHMQKMADHDGRARAAQMLTRGLNAFRATHGAQHPLLAQAAPFLQSLEQMWLYHDTPARVLSRQAQGALRATGHPAMAEWARLSQASEDALRLIAARKPISQTALDALKQDASRLASQKGLSPMSTFRLKLSALTHPEWSPEKLKTSLSNLTAVLMADAPLDDRLIARGLSHLALELEEGLKEAGPEAQGRYALMKSYRQRIARILDGSERRIFSLAVDNPAHPQPAPAIRKISELARGGVKRDKSLLRAGMRLVSWLDDAGDRRAFRNIAKADAMRRGISEYVDMMRVSLTRRQPQRGVWDRAAFETFAREFQKLSQHSRYATRLMALLAAGAGLGVFVPKTQYLLTRLMTGKNEHPGIANVAHQNGVQTLVDSAGGRFSGSPTPL